MEIFKLIILPLIKFFCSKLYDKCVNLVSNRKSLAFARLFIVYSWFSALFFLGSL